MQQYPTVSLTSSHYTIKRQSHSLRYRQKENDTPLYSQNLGFNLPLHKLCNRKQQKFGQSDSFDTCESQNTLWEEREMPNGKNRKIKVELCKNYVEKGCCPYENRCKFAHGIEELRSKDTRGTSDLYRTRKCKIFYEKHECKFGERCNFMHDSRKISQILQGRCKQAKTAIRTHFHQIELIQRVSATCESRLMQILGVERRIQ